MGRMTTIPKTEASAAKLDVITRLVAPAIRSEEEAYALATAIAEFAEQAINDALAEAGSTAHKLRHQLEEANGKLRRAAALLMEMHGTTGCDPDCVARYHDVFPKVTVDEFYAEVAPIKGDWGPLTEDPLP